MFYDNSILPGTKIIDTSDADTLKFYDNSILPGTKIKKVGITCFFGFTITQFFQVLKYNANK